MDNNWIKCILAGRGGTSSEALIRLNIEGKSTVKNQKAGMAFNPSGYSFKVITNMGKEQNIQISDSNLEFFTDSTYSSKILTTATTTIYVRYKNVSNTINLSEAGIKIEQRFLPIENKNGKWYLKADYCPIYNGNNQEVNYTAAGFQTINTNQSTTSATDVSSQGYKLVITTIAEGWSVPSGYDKEKPKDVYWNIYPAKASIDLQGISTLEVKNGQVVINDKVQSTTTDTFLQEINVAITGAQGFILPITIVDSATSNIKAAELSNDNKLKLTLSSSIINTADSNLGSIQFTSSNFNYSFKVNGTTISSSNNQISFIGNLFTTNIITDDWDTIMNNPDNYNLGDIKILEAVEGYEIARTSKWQMQLVDKTDGVLTFYSTNISNEQTSDYDILNSVTENYFIDLNANVITTASFINNGNEITARSKFWLGTEYQIKSDSSNAPGMKKFQYISEPQNDFKLIQTGEYYLAESNKEGSPSDRYIATLDTYGMVNYYNTNPYAYIRLGFKIAKDPSASIPTITEGASLKDLSDFISAKTNGSTTATYESKGFIPGSRFLSPESFQLSDGTILKGAVYIAAIDKANNIVTLQSSYLKKNDDIYIIKTDSIFEKFQYQQNYKGSELENIYSNMQVLNVPNVIQQNTISTQNYVLTGQSPVNKASTMVGTCYLPSAAECGITTTVLNNITYNIPTLGDKTSYPADIVGIKTIFDVANSPSYWARIRDNIIYNGRSSSAYGLCGINNGILIPAGWQDNTGTALGESQRNDRYQKITLTPRFKIGG